jgi:hypothetical protein
MADLREQTGMTQATQTPPEPAPHGHDAIAAGLALQGEPLARPEDLTALETRLSVHVQRLLPTADVVVSQMWRGGRDWWDAATTLATIRRHLDAAPPAGLTALQERVIELAQDAEWLTACITEGAAE